ncbi:MAG: Membrane protein involved in the export of O-antigen and teichoic acid-like protein, partial [Alphaproteobacteria bacterium]|nr:Membrane protein involved in the export of O-antigen and teichoic acid-like protein [Alphaproteobacteria bacterium]
MGGGAGGACLRGGRLRDGAAPAKENRAGRLIVRGTASSGLGFAIRFGARFLFLFVAGRLFGATLFGAYSISIAVVEAAVIAGGLSTKWMLFKWLNEREGEGDRPAIHIVIDTALMVFAASAAIAAAIMALAAAAPSRWIGANAEVAIFALALMIPLQALIELLLAATRWTEVMRYEVVAKNVMQPYGSIAVAILAWWLGWMQEGLVLSYIAGTIASLVYTLYGVRRCFGGLGLRRYRPDLRRISRHFRAAMPTTGTELIDALYTRLDIYVVGILLGASWAGIYGMARQLSMPIRQARQAFDGMLVPIVARTFSHSGPTSTGRSIASAARLVFIVQLAGVIALTAIGSPLLHALGKGFHAAYGALLCLAAAEVIQGAFGLGELVLIYSRPRVAVAMTAGFMIVGVAGAVLLEPHLGLTGVALAVLLSYSGRAVVRRILLRRLHAVEIPTSSWWGPLAAAA